MCHPHHCITIERALRGHELHPRTHVHQQTKYWAVRHPTPVLQHVSLVPDGASTTCPQLLSVTSASAAIQPAQCREPNAHILGHPVTMFLPPPTTKRMPQAPGRLAAATQLPSHPLQLPSPESPQPPALVPVHTPFPNGRPFNSCPHGATRAGCRCPRATQCLSMPADPLHVSTALSPLHQPPA
jgi:hypothetical protein